ncbi:2-vinyl bacteriochlorophyllide hydratase [Erythrobacter longus]|uniref:2-vinyl bacteriochlorophyllide hydratase n=1 Tax=Erythrobacter longus TaxID=1044 RepID=UPI0009DE6893|nr:2-vinyl bacteriochlorophyllide hydratase [Erythrobacter longus]
MTRTTHTSQAISPPPNANLARAQESNDHRSTGSLYSPEERQRRDDSVWTVVQGVLAPLQFLVFIISLGLVLRTLSSGEGAFAADVSIIVKTLILYTIMITGSIWEKVVFGKWLFAESFFWEDVFSMLVLALHTAYLVMLFGAIGTVEQRLGVALAGYAAYVINAGQFLWKLRQARLQGSTPQEEQQQAVPA